MAAEGARRVLLGVGNLDRGDDAAGRIAADLLRGRLPQEIDIMEDTGDAASLLARLEGARAAVIIDACRSGAATGRIRRFDVSKAPLPEEHFATSTHALGLAAVIELARALKQLPARCIVYAVEGARFDAGAGLSPPVAMAIRALAPYVIAEFEEARAL